LRLAFTHPGLVRRVVASGVQFGARNPQSALTLSADRWPRAFRDEYGRVSPDGPRHWSALFAKIRLMWAKSSWGISELELARIKVPTLIVAGDRDYSRVEETTRIFRSIPNARLCILPETGHTTFQDRPDWLNSIILDFLDRK
jgi:pimeloyl-ACP methyl ester carboxylesterase